MIIKSMRLCVLLMIIVYLKCAHATSLSDEHTHSSPRNVKPHPDTAFHNHNHNHDDNAHEGTEALKTIELSKLQRSLVDIEVAKITPRHFEQVFYAPAEVKANGYTSYIVSPRTESVVISRHAVLGEKVSEGRKLVTLFSHEMAQAQADYLLAKSDWERTALLAREAVSASERVAAQTRFDAAYGRLAALGLNDLAIQKLHSSARETLGQYTLVAEQAGVVLKDDFSQGQRIPAGSELMLLADERTLWVEAKLSASADLEPEHIMKAVVSFDNREYVAQVIQQTHTIDKKTRTKIVRLSVENPKDSLHAGMFVDVSFFITPAHKEMIVPESAVMRDAEQNWVVFTEQPNKTFLPIQVQLGKQLGDERIVYGLPAGSLVAVKGAFFIASESAKNGFDPHNH
ncbi:efflux RND transporter periplasmic adaptor subunit [Pseudoalteromonas luteoviolacea]|uniref:efflux RND transporter periplasmic adaptor subunit n=1 Tax=Pseudoalteromonas luteoviolacea TaxID=43657 RepID=UPI000B0A4733|nr:efflux RND transporter periplasmic adaptor subunit [Pseudoalteromonas luteoviolacea]